MRKRKAFQDDDDDDDEFDQDTQDILQAMRGEEEDDDGDSSSGSSHEAESESFGDIFWRKNFVMAATVTKYLGAACLVIVFLFFVTLVLKAFAFR